MPIYQFLSPSPIEGTDLDGLMYAAELCFLPDVVIPHKFKVPELEKDDGTTCPKSDLVMYCRKMAACTQDDK